jgi:hypothetical protein
MLAVSSLSVKSFFFIFLSLYSDGDFDLTFLSRKHKKGSRFRLELVDML